VTERERRIEKEKGKKYSKIFKKKRKKKKFVPVRLPAHNVVGIKRRRRRRGRKRKEIRIVLKQ